jgi:hypothetical protein
MRLGEPVLGFRLATKALRIPSRTSAGASARADYTIYSLDTFSKTIPRAASEIGGRQSDRQDTRRLNEDMYWYI